MMRIFMRIRNKNALIIPLTKVKGIIFDNNQRMWKYLCNIDVIAGIIIIIVVIYCIVTSKRKKSYDFQGLGESGFALSEGMDGIPSTHRRYRRHKRRKRVNKHEERCREIFQNIFGYQFKSVRPNWLKNPATGKNLELDGYCPTIHTPLGQGLAFEYDGEQHAKYNKHFHGHNPKRFLYQIKKDEWKDIQCKKHRTLLLRIPHYVAYEDLDRYIRAKLRKNGIEVNGVKNHKNSKHYGGLYE